MAVSSRLGTLDSFSLGFTLVHRRPWLLAIPLLLNLFLWLGPALTVGPLASAWLDTYVRLLHENPAVAELQGASVEELQERAQQLAGALAGVNLLRVLALQTPSLPFETAAGGPRWEVTSAGGLALALTGLFLAALLIASAYLTLVAETVRMPGREFQQLRVWLGSNWLHLLGYYALMVAVATPLFLGLTMVLLTAMIFSQAVASVFISLSFGLFMLAQFYLFFVPQAIFLARDGPVRAVLHSALVMGRFFWSSLWFILLNWVIGTGFTLIFSRIYDWQPAGPPVALLGHAYISTGLVAAAMVYFQNRAQLLSAARDPRLRISVPG